MAPNNVQTCFSRRRQLTLRIGDQEQVLGHERWLLNVEILCLAFTIADILQFMHQLPLFARAAYDRSS